MVEAAEASRGGLKPALRARLIDAKAYLADMERLVPVNATAPLSLWAGERDDDGLLEEAGELSLRGPLQRLLAALSSTDTV